MHQRMDQVMPRLHRFALAAVTLLAGAGAAVAQDAPPPQPLSPVMRAPLDKSRAAIAECRERRLRKELTTYKQSAQCSNPRIFAAWQEAGYPHMDLITMWLNAREEASEKVDQHAITPREFEEQMDALTVRLTNEEQRRRSGLIISPDGDLRLQLPPAGSVVGVVTPPAEEKLTAKKTAAARERAAAAVPAETSGVGGMAALSPLDSQRSQTGVGGPFVPVPANSPAARAAMARAAPGEGSSGLYAQLAAQRNEAEARTTYRSLQGRYPTALASRDAVIRRADDPSQGTYYRVEIGPLTLNQADELCGSIKTAGGLCVPRYE
jgi:hypothetical protein